VDNRPPLLLFRERMRGFGPESETWILAAPFWSRHAGASLFEELKPGRNSIPRRVHAFFRDETCARTYVPGLRRPGTTISAKVPSRGAAMHQKLVAWRGRRGTKTLVLLYVGSANLTEAGFLGVAAGNSRTAWNWEAGVVFVGGEELWPVAQSAARAARRWREVEVPKRPRKILPAAECDVDETTRLCVHLRSVVTYTKRTVSRRRSWPDLPGIRLTRVIVAVDDDVKAKSLGPGQRVRIPGKGGIVRVTGIYSGRAPVEIELGELASAPRDDLDASALVLTDLLRLLGRDTDCDAPDREFSDDWTHSMSAKPGQPVPGDVRFPYRALLEARERDRDGARRWLQRAARQAGRGDVPPFWRAVAKRLL
jgi:hypothetical protein